MRGKFGGVILAVAGVVGGWVAAMMWHYIPPLVGCLVLGICVLGFFAGAYMVVTDKSNPSKSTFIKGKNVGTLDVSDNESNADDFINAENIETGAVNRNRHQPK